MYEAIEAHAAEFDELRAVLARQDSVTIEAIRSALEATASRIGETQSHSELDRNNLSRLYRGFMAASRVLGHFQEVGSAASR
ncbi:type III secretion protein [Trinickia acidisoli]|uniref:type III secretion protein n=1 Tax=Trinickia acidisoli TaxID=2767482 RepID=UPI001A8E1FF2|nr:type III secretion protein [Trinickia acidisoli]